MFGKALGEAAYGNPHCLVRAAALVALGGVSIGCPLRGDGLTMGRDG